MDKIRDGDFEAVLNRINEMRGYPLSYVARDGIEMFLRDISATEGWGAVERLVDKITKMPKVPDNTLGAMRTMWDEMGRKKHNGNESQERPLTDYEDDRRRCELWCAIYKHNHLDITAFDGDRYIPELSRVRTMPYRQGIAHMDTDATCTVMVKFGEYKPEEIMHCVVERCHSFIERLSAVAQNIQEVLEALHEDNTNASNQEPLNINIQTQDAVTANLKGCKK